MSYNNNDIDNDEVIARALQEEYEREYRRRSMRQHLRQSHSNRNAVVETNLNRLPTAPEYSIPQSQDPTLSVPSGIEYPMRETQSRSVRNTSHTKSSQNRPGSNDRRHRSTTSSEIRDATFPETTLNSRFGEITDEEFNFERKPSQPTTRSSKSNLTVPPVPRQTSNRNTRNSTSTGVVVVSGRPLSSTLQSNNAVPRVPVASLPKQTSNRSFGNVSSTGVVVVSGRPLSDEELARRIAQEEQDAALARSISNDQAIAVAVESHRSQPTKTSLTGRLFRVLISLGVLGAAIWLLWFYFGSSKNVPNFTDPEIFRKEDPFTNLNPDDSPRWRNKGQGLELTLINALDVSWNEYFYQAVDDWDGGTPDSLKLTTQTGTPDSVCRAETGFLKVCNGDYGATNWRGINKVLLENNFIYASAARMNEFYFSGTDTYQRQYTMCHEIGHGFGLPHSDENFYNKDLGNCMDYTNNPENNMAPDDTNYIFLADLYGSFDGTYTSPPEPVGGTVEASEAVPKIDTGNSTVSEHEPDKKPAKEDDGGRRLRSNLSFSLDTTAKRLKMQSMSEEMDIWFDIVSIQKSPLQPGWRRLHGNEYAEGYEVDLGDGYRIQYHLLRAA